MITIRRDKIEIIYTISVVLAFALLFFANADLQEAPDGTKVHLGIGKSFYIPCGLALICSFMMHRPNDRMNHALNCLIGLAITSTLLNIPSTFNILEWTCTRFVMAILCFRDIRIVNPKRLVLYTSIIAPFIVIPHYILSNPFGYGAYRYGGFYGDPNFLAIALNLLIVMCYLSIKIHDRLIIRVLSITAIVSAIPLILLGVSRGGILGLVIILYYILHDIYAGSKIRFSMLLVVILLLSGQVISRMGDTITFIESRFSNESSSDANGAHARIEGIESAFNVFMNHPISIPLGIGPGQTMPKIQDYRKYGYYCKYAIHNTYFSFMYEFGVIALYFFLFLFWHAYQHLKHYRLHLLIGLLLSNVMGLFTLPGVAFMPSWILLFFITNHHISELKNQL